ncbi:sporulation protein [Rossellomorea oryzaecorticis]|uniref:Sporulation protein n=2 Tax=Rossellomorea oryzaecorticis TaxID=1396505 RepID=A0ABU9KBU5_9BACI
MRQVKYSKLLKLFTYSQSSIPSSIKYYYHAQDLCYDGDTKKGDEFMSMFNKVIASFGIGSATVDTKLKSAYIQQGEILEGIIEVKGGSTEQRIETINLKLMTMVGHEGSDRLSPATVEDQQLNQPFTISKGERKTIPFSFQVPLDTPITMIDPETQKNVPPVWIDTAIDIRNAFDPKDKDFVSVDPTTVHENIIDAIKVIGFKFQQMESQDTPSWIKTNRPFVQQFEFIPSYGKYSRKLDELEVYILQGDRETTVYFEIDKRSKGSMSVLKEKFNLDEHRGSVTLDNQQILINRSRISDTFEQIIDDVL